MEKRMGQLAGVLSGPIGIPGQHRPRFPYGHHHLQSLCLPSPIPSCDFYGRLVRRSHYRRAGRHARSGQGSGRGLRCRYPHERHRCRSGSRWSDLLLLWWSRNRRWDLSGPMAGQDTRSGSQPRRRHRQGDSSASALLGLLTSSRRDHQARDR